MDAKGKRRYVPPQPDDNTFPTQEAFLDSLLPVPIDSVSEDNRKCHHCWKYYGQPDPGADNMEYPVRFRCGHTFGEKCIKEELFPKPKAIVTKLQPLAFVPGASGLRLAINLETCVLGELSKPEFQEKSAKDLNVLRDVFTAIVQRLSRNETTHLDAEWCTHIRTVLSSHQSLLKVHFFENAIIYDVDERPIHHSPPPIQDYGPSPDGGVPTAATTFALLDVFMESDVSKISEPFNLSTMKDIGSKIEQLVNAPSVEASSKFSDDQSSEQLPSKQKVAQENAINEYNAKKKAYDLKFAQWNNQRTAANQKRAADAVATFAEKLLEVHTAYENHKSVIKGTFTAPPASPPTPYRSIMTSSTVHKESLGSLKLQVLRPYVNSYDDYEDDEIEIQSEGEETGEETFGIPTSLEKESDPVIREVILINRQLCVKSCFKEKRLRTRAVASMTATTPEEVNWKEQKKTANSCPICRRILFLHGKS